MPERRTAAIRAFVALDLDPISLRRVARVADRLRMGSGAPSATWTPAAKMHVTLKFMDALPIDGVAPLAAAIRPLVEGKPAPDACAMRLEAFPAPKHARVVVVALEDAGGAVAKLADKVDRLAQKVGVPREDRPFRPHVTLARLKRPYDARRWLRPDLAEGAGACRAEGVTLFRSEPGPDGSLYVPLAHFAFA